MQSVQIFVLLPDTWAHWRLG